MTALMSGWRVEGACPLFPTSHAHGAGTSECEHLGTHQGIEEDDVTVLEDLMAAARQQTGIAGTGPHEIDRSPDDGGLVHGRGLEQEPCPPWAARARGFEVSALSLRNRRRRGADRRSRRSRGGALQSDRCVVSLAEDDITVVSSADDIAGADRDRVHRRPPSRRTRTVVSALAEWTTKVSVPVERTSSRRRTTSVFQAARNKRVMGFDGGFGSGGMAVAHGGRRVRGSLVVLCSGPAPRAHTLPVLRASVRNDPAGPGGGSASRG
jgi:hypothetical protein